jgi:hypothetical protein
MHDRSLRAQLSFTDRTASSNAELPPHQFAEPPRGLFSQPSQATQEQSTQQQTGRQPLDLRKTAAITVAIANVQIHDEDMNASQDAGAGPSSSRPPLAMRRNDSSCSRPLTVEIASRVPSQDMW